MLGKSHAFINADKGKHQRHIRELQDDVLKYLLEHRGKHFLKDIKNGTGIDLLTNQKLLNNLRAHDRIKFEENALSYLPVHPGINDIEDLRAYINQHRQGLSEESLLDSYIGVSNDLQKLKTENDIIAIQNNEGKHVMLYPKDPRLEIVIDDDIKKLWHEIIMPGDDLELERELHAAGLMTLEELETGHQTSQRRKRPAKRAKEAKTESKRRRYQVTNIHVIDQFKFLQDNAR